jgi:hypothetical protein
VCPVPNVADIPRTRDIRYNPPVKRERFRKGGGVMPRRKQFDVEIKTAMTDKTLGQLQRLAASDNRTVSDLVRDAIKRYLQEHAEEE